MARIDLKSSSGFPATYDGEELLIKDFSFKSKRDVTIDDVRNQLLNKELNCPEIFYTKYKQLDNNDIYQSKGITINFYVVPPNLAGIEYVKTRATRASKYPRIFDFVYGGATVLIQNYSGVRKNKVIKTTVKKKDKIIIPVGYDVAIVNVRQNSNLIFTEYYSTKAKPKVVLDERNGLAYYIIRKNAKQETVRNPSYKIINEPDKVDWDSIREEYGITPKTPIIKQIMRKYERFDWLFKENSVQIPTA
jgi:oxalate decarboxylase/phosphoglucose isomerase-like protein (cupin superfamily)